MDPAIILRPASTLSAAQVFDFHAEVCGSPRPESLPEGAFRGFGYAALGGDDIVGLMTGSLMTDSDGAGARSLYLTGGVRPAWRRRGIGRSLIEELERACRDIGPRTTAIFDLSEAQLSSAGTFLKRMGFVEDTGAAVYERDLRGATPPPAPDGAYATRLYRGGDAALDEAIVDLYRRAYRGHANVPELTVEGLRRHLSNPDFVYLLVFDSDRLAGHASAFVATAEYYVDSILVARRYWGTAAADTLGHAITRHALEVGARRLTGIARTTNRANRALMERHGLQVREVRSRYRRTFEIG